MLRLSLHRALGRPAVACSSTRSAPSVRLRTYATPPASLPKRSAVDIGLVVGAGLLISGGLVWQKLSRETEQVADAERSSFTVPVLNQTGMESTKTLALLSQSETDARLKEHEASYEVARKSNPVFRYDTNALASNSPIEDDSCCVILERDPASATKGDLMFWGVMDGHSGWQTSKLVSSSLVSYVARELDLVFRSSAPYLQIIDPAAIPAPSPSFWSLLSSSPPPKQSLELDMHDKVIQQAIKTAFKNLDDTIVNAPVRLLEKLQKEGKIVKPGRDGHMSPEQTEALNTLLPALSGSCALLAFLDAGRNKLHVAVTGDSRAVMGTWEQSSDGKGRWRAEALSEDQTGNNPSEVARIKSEHPPSEAETVIARGRVLGNLEPSRAFGDARYKWEIGVQEKLAEAFHPGSVRGRPRNYHTPPYVVAEPEVVSVDLSKTSPPVRRSKSLSSFLPVVSSAEPLPPTAKRFIVLATDGLYDRLNNDEVVALVGAHLSGIRGTQSRSSVLSHVAPSSTISAPAHTHAPRQEPQRGEGDVYVFEDNNLATHLTRNALGGAKREQVSALLSIPSPLSRRYRDDITIHVILLGEGEGGEAGGTGGVRRRESLPDSPRLKSKL